MVKGGEGERKVEDRIGSRKGRKKRGRREEKRNGGWFQRKPKRKLKYQENSWVVKPTRGWWAGEKGEWEIVPFRLGVVGNQ